MQPLYMLDGYRAWSQVFLLAVFHRLRPKSTSAFEILSLAVPLPAALASWMVSSDMLVTCCCIHALRHAAHHNKGTQNGSTTKGWPMQQGVSISTDKLFLVV